MKKFLSVLLALAVAFTFTFGSTMSAFASVDNPYHYGAEGDAYATQAAAEKAYLDDVDTAYELAVQTAKSNYEIAKIKVNNKGKTNATDASATHKIAASYWLTQLDNVYADTLNALDKEKKTLQGEDNITALTKKIDVSDFKTPTGDGALVSATYAGDYAIAAMKAAFADYKAERIAEANAVNLAVFSTTEYTKDTASDKYQWSYPVGTATVDCYVAKDVAAGYIAYTIAAINKVAVDSTEKYKVDTLDDVYDDVDEALEAYVQVVENADKTITATLTNIPKPILTKVSETTADANKAAAIAKAKADLEGKVAVAVAEAENLTSAERALWETVKAAYVEVETAKIDGSKEEVASFPKVEYDEKVTEVIGSDAAKNYLNAVDLVKKYNALAAELKAKRLADGTPAYDAKAIDELLANTLKEVYNFSVKKYDDTVFKSAALNSASAYDKEKAKTDMAAKFDADNMTQSEKVYTTDATEEAYYAKEWAAVEAALAAYNSAVDAAANKEDIATAKTELDKALATDKIANKAAVDALYADSDMVKAVTAAANIAKAYRDTLNVNKDSDDQISYDTRVDALNVWFAKQGARTAAEVTALVDALKADIAATKTTNQIKDAAKAVQALIDALPGKLTVKATDKDQIVAAKDAYDAFIKDGGSDNNLKNVDRIDADLLALAGIEDAAIKDAIKAIEKGVASNVVLADKEAVKNVVALEEAYNDLYVTKYKVADEYDDNGFAKATMEKIRGLEKTAVKDAIDALPTTITAADKAAVEAARAAYDAFVEEYTFYDANNVFGEPYDAVKQLELASVNLAKLEAAEATIAELTKYDDIHAKADLLDMSRKLTIWRTSKTSIRVTAVGSVANIKANGYTVKYSFYKKAPSATSYKLVKTTTSNKYTYTNLKKGTNKFQVKVKVYDADGKLVATKMTYYRAAKIK